MSFVDGVREFLWGLGQYNKVPAKQPKHVSVPKETASGIVIPKQTRAWKGIVWHHSLTKDNVTLDNWKAIKKWHVEHNGWSDIGYHAGFERVNGELSWCIGRPWTRSGAHSGVPGNNTFNEEYLGICAVGNFDLKAPDKEMWEACQKATRLIMDNFGISRKKVLGHREVYDKLHVPRKKSCPGTEWDMVEFRRGL